MRKELGRDAASIIFDTKAQTSISLLCRQGDFPTFRCVTQCVGNKAEVTIQDSGEGVTAEDAAHLFDRFYRVDASRTRDSEAGGSGLGLAIAKSIIELHGGSIHAKSGENGSEFFITFDKLDFH